MHGVEITAMFCSGIISIVFKINRLVTINCCCLKTGVFFPDWAEISFVDFWLPLLLVGVGNILLTTTGI